eukprot:COSAG01_NODE_1430_length_10325_cov_7.452376_1_plen_52_part_00
MSVEKHFTHDCITPHTMKSYQSEKTMMMPIESNRECFYLGMHNVHAFSRVF